MCRVGWVDAGVEDGPSTAHGLGSMKASKAIMACAEWLGAGVSWPQTQAPQAKAAAPPPPRKESVPRGHREVREPRGAEKLH